LRRHASYQNVFVTDDIPEDKPTTSPPYANQFAETSPTPFSSSLNKREWDVTWCGAVPLDDVTLTEQSHADTPSACLNMKQPKPKRVFDKHLRQYVKPFCPHRDNKIIYSALPTHSGRHLITTATDDYHKVWDTAALKGLWTLGGAGLAHHTESALSSDDSYLVSGSADGGLYVWDVYGTIEAQTQQGNFCARIQAHDYPITAVCTSPDDTMIVSGDEGGSLRVTSG